MSIEADGDDMGRTTISVSDELADELYERKGRGESYEDVLWRLLEDDGRGKLARDPRGQGGETAEPESEEASIDHAAQSLDQIIDEVAHDVLPGSGEKFEEREAAFKAVVSYLRENGSATPEDFKREVYPDHRAQYTEGEDPARSWWKNAMYKGLRELAERSGEIGKSDHTGEWTYRGEA
jgi:predicted CopG family antitoxin